MHAVALGGSVRKRKSQHHHQIRGAQCSLSGSKRNRLTASNGRVYRGGEKQERLNP